LLVCAIEVEEERGGGMRIIFVFFLFSIFVGFLCCRVLSDLHCFVSKNTVGGFRQCIYRFIFYCIYWLP
jgi:hypothetical protein